MAVAFCRPACITRVVSAAGTQLCMVLAATPPVALVLALLLVVAPLAVLPGVVFPFAGAKAICVLTGAGAVLLALCWQAWRGALALPRHWLLGALGAWVALQLLAWAMGPAPLWALLGAPGRWGGLLPQLAVAACALGAMAAAAVPAGRRALLGGYMAGAGLAAVYAAVAAWGLLPAGWPSFGDAFFHGRWYGSLGQPNLLAAYLLPAMPLLAAGLWRGRTARTATWWGGCALLALVALVLVMSGSRGALLGLAGGAAAVLLAVAIRSRRWVPAALAIIVLALALLFPRVHLAVDRSLASRFIIWGDAAALAQQLHGLPGGLDAFALRGPSVASTQLFLHERFTDTPDRTHNIFLEFLLSYGIPGLLWLLAVAAGVGRASWAALRRGQWHWAWLWLAWLLCLCVGFGGLVHALAAAALAAVQLLPGASFRSISRWWALPLAMGGSLFLVLSVHWAAAQRLAPSSPVAAALAFPLDATAAYAALQEPGPQQVQWLAWGLRLSAGADWAYALHRGRATGDTTWMHRAAQLAPASPLPWADIATHARRLGDAATYAAARTAVLARLPATCQHQHWDAPVCARHLRENPWLVQLLWPAG